MAVPRGAEKKICLIFYNYLLITNFCFNVSRYFIILTIFSVSVVCFKMLYLFAAFKDKDHWTPCLDFHNHSDIL